MSELEQILALIDKYGLTIVVVVVGGIGFVSGFIRLGREVKREEQATVRERQIGDGKDILIASLTSELKEQTVATNRLADAIEERNRIEVQMRGRRT